MNFNERIPAICCLGPIAPLICPVGRSRYAEDAVLTGRSQNITSPLSRGTGTASTHNSQHFNAVLDPANACREVYADKGYPNAAREAQLKEAGCRNRIQRKGVRNNLLLARQEMRNKRIAKICARV
ncbi:hypothetical protein NTG1052_570010 [Candidatus Nitrotoga sp. 1052]|nr:hypothetical protein NTG1052_570010 [Candidatus Nitrotoga sp. 1052]